MGKFIDKDVFIKGDNLRHSAQNCCLKLKGKFTTNGISVSILWGDDNHLQAALNCHSLKVKGQLCGNEFLRFVGT